ncbi:MAG: hypothetical protein SVM80_12165, partial [Halobacteriota archaeon]|nr:hypothetical protein [Halobacteriota archaeon]
METLNQVSLDLDEKIISQLIAMNNFFYIFPSKSRLSEFVSRAVMIVPGVSSCCMCIQGLSKPERDLRKEQCMSCTVPKKSPDDISRHDCSLAGHEGIRIFPLETANRIYGFLILNLQDQREYEPYEPYLSVFANSVAITIENRWQKDQLKTLNEEISKHRDHLEDLVEERTSELIEINMKLQQEIADRKLAEEALRDERNRAQMYLDVAGVILIMINKNEEVTLV